MITDEKKGKLIKIRISVQSDGTKYKCSKCGKEGEVEGETLWARYIGDNKAKLDNIPFFAEEIGLGDLVEINDDCEIIRVLEKATVTRKATYKISEDKEETIKKWKRIWKYFENTDIKTEGSYPGLFSLSIPIDMNDKRLREICENCSVKIDLIEVSVDQ